MWTRHRALLDLKCVPEVAAADPLSELDDAGGLAIPLAATCNQSRTAPRVAVVDERGVLSMYSATGSRHIHPNHTHTRGIPRPYDALRVGVPSLLFFCS